MAETNEVENQYKVKLQHPFDRTRKVVFEVTPELLENRAVNYKTLDPVHMPGQIYVYATTSSRTFNIANARLVSRTPTEAQKNLEILHMLRFWTMPRFGRQNELESAQLGQLGAPPDVLLLSAYSDVPKDLGNIGDANQKMGHLNRIPTVITNLSINYPSDVDYIPTLGNTSINDPGGQPMPTLMSVDVQLSETHSPFEYENFSLSQFKNGTLPGF